MIGIGAAGMGRPSRRRGAVLVLVAAGLLCFCLFLGLVVDVGFWYSRKAQVQLNADIALLAAMGRLDQNSGTVDSQQTFITNTVRGIVAANGYDSSLWTFDFANATVGSKTFVTRAVVNTTQQLPRFFTAVLGVGTLPMATRSTVEKRLIPGMSSSCAILALGTISYGGGGNGQIDSFLGNRTTTQTFEAKPYSLTNANLCSNGGITLNGNVGVFGDLTTGGSISIAGGSYTAVGDFITGGTSSSGPDTTFPGSSFQRLQNQTVPTFTFDTPVPPANIATTNNNAQIAGTCGTPNAAGVWSCNGNKFATLQAGGRYYFTDVRFTGQANIQISGTPGSSTTEIWMDGNMDLAGGMSFNATGAQDGNLNGISAQNLRINGIKNGASITMRGGTELVADIVAPKMNVTLSGNPDFYGRVIANNIDISGNVDFSYDESIPMTTFTAPSSSVKVHLTE